MNLNNLIPTNIRKNKRIGRGYGSGKGKTSGKGQKGQNVRGKVSPIFEGGQLSFVHRLPFLRGRDKNKSIKKITNVINLKQINNLPTGSVIDIELLVKSGIISKSSLRKYSPRILGAGEISNSYIIKVPITLKAKDKIEKAGGKVEI